MPSLYTGAGYIRWMACASALVLTLLPGSAAAQSVRVTGLVTDTTGAAISGADVTLHSSHSTKVVKTNPAGEFAFSGLTDLSGTVRATQTALRPSSSHGLQRQVQYTSILSCEAPGRMSAWWSPLPEAN